MTALIAGFVAALLSAVCVPFVRAYARREGIMDDPNIESHRRMHHHPVPLLGGLAVWIAVTVSIMFFSALAMLTAGYLQTIYLVSLVLASAVIMVGGYLDDRYRLRPRYSILFPLAAAFIMIVSGVGVHFITNPFGGIWRIDQTKIVLFHLGTRAFIFNVGADLFALIWLMGMMYTTKLLDGLDGLVSGVTAIGAIIITLLSLAPPVMQSDTAVLSAIVAGAFLGFLPFNWSPAKIFLGEGGSILAGFFLGVLAIVSGGKIATTLLVIGIPALDVAWVIVRRLWEGNAIKSADRKHLHFRLLDFLTVRQTVMFYYILALVFGLVALGARSFGKLIALAGVVLIMVFMAAVLVRARQPSPHA